ncbi:MAG: HAD family phosphatase [Gloeocapsa sp. DLM2.Bin57]|nr:MAG: HAD family phosphatase [Gloeocapsa sp. DLM2.Bin57]
MFSTLLFDLDGTLVNTDSVHFLSWQKILRRYNLNIDIDFFNQYISGKHNPDIVKTILPQLSSAESQAIIREKEADYRNLIADKIEPLPGLHEFLAWAKSLNFKLGLVTNAPRLNVNLLINSLGLNDTFDVMIIGEDLPLTKPHPFPYQEALNQLGVNNSEACSRGEILRVAFEDSPAGVMSAVGAGITTVGVLSSHSSDTLLKLGVNWVIEDFRDANLERLGYSWRGKIKN